MHSKWAEYVMLKPLKLARFLNASSGPFAGAIAKPVGSIVFVIAGVSSAYHPIQTWSKLNRFVKVV